MSSDENSLALFKFDIERLSFDPLALCTRLSAAEDWGKLVVCHIYLDHILTESLKDHVPKAEHYLDSGYKTFADKISLCQALEIIDDEIATTLKAINRCRNKFAHRLVFDVPDQTKIDLFREFSPTRPKEDVLGEDGFTNFLLTVVMLAETERSYSKQIAENERERAILRERMLQLALEMLSTQNSSS